MSPLRLHCYVPELNSWSFEVSSPHDVGAPPTVRRVTVVLIVLNFYSPLRNTSIVLQDSS